MSVRNWKPIATSFCLLGAGMIIGSALNAPPAAWGEVRTGTPPAVAFQSGGQQSVPILREIAATLVQMDGRLARLETLAQRMQGQGKLQVAK